MLIATSEAVSKDIGLIATFGGIGVVVNLILVYIAVQIRGERRQNEEYAAAQRQNGGKAA